MSQRAAHPYPCVRPLPSHKHPAPPRTRLQPVCASCAAPSTCTSITYALQEDCERSAVRVVLRMQCCTCSPLTSSHPPPRRGWGTRRASSHACTHHCNASDGGERAARVRAGKLARARGNYTTRALTRSGAHVRQGGVGSPTHQDGQGQRPTAHCKREAPHRARSEHKHAVRPCEGRAKAGVHK